MTDTTFVNQQTVVQASWTQDVNNVVYRLLGPSTGPGGSAPSDRNQILDNLGSAPIVTSIASLRLLLKTENSFAFVTGYTSVGNIQSLYWYNANDTSSADNGVTIIVAADGGRWYLIYNFNVSAQQAGAAVNGTTDDIAALRTVCGLGDVTLPDGTMNVTSGGVTFTTPIYMQGKGALSIIQINALFSQFVNLFTLTPNVGGESRNWQFKDFRVLNAGTGCENVFFINLAAANAFIDKLYIHGIIADQVQQYFFQLSNPNPNTDGLFTICVEDCWSENGYYLPNVGDSVVFQRNTVTGVGRAFYVNQLPGASHAIIQDNNITSAGGALLASPAFNLIFQGNQCECQVTHTGTDYALVNVVGLSGQISINNNILNNNINCGTPNTTLWGVYVQYADNTIIDGNSIFTNPSTGVHIYLDSNAQNTYIGLNRYFSSTTGAEIAPIITDGGTGTAGIWKTPGSYPTWQPQSIGGFTPGFFKDRDGKVLLRGSFSGSASTSGQILFTLPTGFTPNGASVFLQAVGSGVTGSNVQVVITASGSVEMGTAGATSVFLDGLIFSTR
jgi:hypothetical protein